MAEFGKINKKYLGNFNQNAAITQMWLNNICIHTILTAASFFLGAVFPPSVCFFY